MTFLVNLTFCRLDKFDGPIFRGGGGGWVTYIRGKWLIFGMLIGLHIWGANIQRVYLQGAY